MVITNGNSYEEKRWHRFSETKPTHKFNAYPMPHIDDLLDAVGRAIYLTTLDLAKGY